MSCVRTRACRFPNSVKDTGGLVQKACGCVVCDRVSKTVRKRCHLGGGGGGIVSSGPRCEAATMAGQQVLDCVRQEEQWKTIGLEDEPACPRTSRRGDARAASRTRWRCCLCGGAAHGGQAWDVVAQRRAAYVLISARKKRGPRQAGPRHRDAETSAPDLSMHRMVQLESINRGESERLRDEITTRLPSSVDGASELQAARIAPGARIGAV